MTQAEDRCHRIGQTNSVNIYHLVLEDSIDYNLANTIVQKQEIIEKVLNKDDDRGMIDIEIKYNVENKSSNKASLTNEEKETIINGIKTIASLCDGATREDGIGFNKFHAKWGNYHSKLSKELWLERDFLIGAKILNIYKNTQLCSLKEAIEKIIEKL